MQLTGTVEQVLDPVTGYKGDGTAWTKQEFILIITAENNYQDRLLITGFGDRVAAIQTLGVGHRVGVTIALNASQWNGKWYNNINLVKIDSHEIPSSI